MENSIMIKHTIKTEEEVVVNYWKINYLGLNIEDNKIEVILGGYFSNNTLNKKPLQTKIMKFEVSDLLLENSKLFDSIYIKILELEDFFGATIEN